MTYLPPQDIGYIKDIPNDVLVPGGWFHCDGSLKSKAIYFKLFAILGTRYGAGDASNFNLPDEDDIFAFPIGKLTKKIIRCI